MRDTELYRAILGLTPPWSVVKVDLDLTGQQVTVTVAAGDGPFPCPECQAPVPGYDKKSRRWRHLDTCQFTALFEPFAIDLLRECAVQGVPICCGSPGTRPGASRPGR